MTAGSHPNNPAHEQQFTRSKDVTEDRPGKYRDKRHDLPMPIPTAMSTRTKIKTAQAKQHACLIQSKLKIKTKMTKKLKGRRKK